MRDVLIYDSGIESKFKTFAINFFITQRAVKILDNSQPFRTFIFLKIEVDFYHFLRGKILDKS